MNFVAPSGRRVPAFGAAVAAIPVWLAACGTTPSPASPETDAAADAPPVRDDSAEGDVAGDAGEGIDADAEPLQAFEGGEAGGRAADAESDAGPDSASTAEGGGNGCASSVDCRTFSDYCRSCACDALRATDPDPTCEGGTVSCFVDPCRGRTAVCGPTGRCTIQ